MIIPLRTIWTRDEGWRIGESEFRPADLRLTFSGALGIPLPNPFGEDNSTEYDKTITVEGFSIYIDRADWVDGEIFLHMEILSLPPGGMATAIPLAAIIIALALATGLILLIALLSRIEAVFNLPATWIIAGGIGILALPLMARNIRKVIPA